MHISKTTISENSYNFAYGNSLYTKDGKHLKDGNQTI